jgi:hypothetical protein
LDDPLLERLRLRGFKSAWRIEPFRDLGIRDARAGIETIQSHINPETAGKIASAHGKPDVVVAGFILEHAHHLRRFVEGLKTLIGMRGFIVVSVPDTRGDLETLDYSKIWEEHVLYFTPKTFCSAPSFFDLSLVHHECYPYRLADCLMGIWQPKKGMKPSFPSKKGLDDEMFVTRGYAEKFYPTRRRIRAMTGGHKKNGSHVALFGAGHLACMFVNLMGLKDDIDFVVDDDQKKHGYLLPGSRLPIYRSAALLEKEIKLCLLSLNPEKEEAVIKTNRAFLDRGGKFLSIFPTSTRALN